MATLVDELLNDFGDFGGINPHENGVELSEDINQGNDIDLVDDMEVDVVKDDDDMPKNEKNDLMNNSQVNGRQLSEKNSKGIPGKHFGDIKTARDASLLMKMLPPVLEKVTQYQNLPAEKRNTYSCLEDNPEYQILTQSNALSTSIDSAIIFNHKFIRDHYSIRFPELETLITNSIDYAKTVAIIGNGPMDNLRDKSINTDNIVGQSLKSVLDGPTLMVVTVEATTTRGREMTAEELGIVLEACERTLQLSKAKKLLTDYVESRMNMFAPNLTALVGSLSAAQFLNIAGGLQGLAKTPSCNIPPLGSKKQAQTGLATNVGVQHQGYLYFSPIIREAPSDLKRQAMRIVSAKVVIAARIDLSRSYTDGKQGELLKEQCLERFRKLTEAPPNRGVRALPAPDDKPARKRGGKRVRKAKEATAMTELRRAQNRMPFGKEEKEVGYGDTTKGLGTIGQEGEGRIRALQINLRVKAKKSKKNAGWDAIAPLNNGTMSTIRGLSYESSSSINADSSELERRGIRTSGIGINTSGNSTVTGGIVSTIAFTPFQGLELADPHEKRKMELQRQRDHDRWFKGGTFTQIPGSSTTISRSAVSAYNLPDFGKRKRDDV